MNVFGYELNEMDLYQIEQNIEANDGESIPIDPDATLEANRFFLRLVITCTVICDKYGIGRDDPKSGELWEKMLANPECVLPVDISKVH